MSRRLARKQAFFVIYQLDFHPDSDIMEINESVMDFDKGSPYELSFAENDLEFIQTEIKGTSENLEEIDTMIKKHCIKWDFERLNKIDVAILRLAIYELKYREDIPQNVTVNEAVELAKGFGTDESAGFVNGVLAEIIKSGLCDE